MPKSGPANKKRKLKKGVKRTLIILIVLITVVVALGVTVYFLPDIPVMRIKTVTVAGDDAYDPAEVISAADIKPGTSLLKVNLFKTSRTITTQLPYIQKVKLHYSFNGTLTITVQKAVPSFQIKTPTGYYLLNDDYKALRQPRAREENVVLIVGTNADETVTVGEKAVSEPDENWTVARDILRQTQEYDLKVNVLDLSNSANIILICEERFYLELGTTQNLAEKLKLYVAMHKEFEAEDEGRVLLNYWSSDSRKASLISQSIDDLLSAY